MRYLLLVCFSWLCLNQAAAQTGRLQFLLDSLRTAANYPGLSMAIVTKEDRLIALTSGYNDRDKRSPLSTSHRFLQGSVGKTYASAIALRLVQQGRIDLDKKVSDYLAHHGWYARIPNASGITVRMLLNHTSGVMRYEFKDEFLKDLTANPDKTWRPEDLLQYVLDEKASFAPGEGWEYSDTNYILLGMIIEQVTGLKYYDLLEKDILVANNLDHTFPQDQRKLEGLAQGYAGPENEFGGKDQVIDTKGVFIINPQFEWTGGGVYSTTSDLAKWGKLLYEGKIVDTGILLSSAVEAKLGKDTKYALGVIIRSTVLGPSYGHSGFFPGYLTELLYFPNDGFSIALQCNSSDIKQLRLPLLRCAMILAQAVKHQTH
jgi:D-alanyl-D-alanine carboxypeptidase